MNSSLTDAKEIQLASESLSPLWLRPQWRDNETQVQVTASGDAPGTQATSRFGVLPMTEPGMHYDFITISASPILWTSTSMSDTQLQEENHSPSQETKRSTASGSLEPPLNDPVPGHAAESSMAVAPSTSLGSEKHGVGKCKPCAWYWKPRGCHNKDECFHCHSCPQGEVKRRQKAKRSAIRDSPGLSGPSPPGLD